MFKSMFTFITTMALALGVSVTAVAEDGKIYAAAECVDVSSGSDVRYYGGRAYNNGTATRTIECPIVKDSIGSTQIHDAHFYVKDLHFTSNVSCSLWTQAATTSGAWGWYTSRSSSGTNTNPQQLLYPAQPIYANHGYGVFRCSVPGRYSGQASWLVSYRADET